MTNIVTEYPVKTLDGLELLPAGTELTEEILEELANKNTAASYESLPFIDYGTIRQDLSIFINYTPYNIFFSDQKQLQDILKVMEDVILPLPVLDTMEYFKQNDFQTYRHIIMVFLISVLLANKLLPEHRELFSNVIIGSTHDIGKTNVPLEILKKQTPLTINEFKQLKHHAVAGYVLLTYFLKDENSFVAKLARDHHERRDGSGYPRGIELNNRMVEIVAIADIYDALLMPRSYRPISYDNRTAIEVITKMAEYGVIGRDISKAIIAQNRITKPNYQDITIPEEERGKAPMGNIYGKIEDD